MAMNTTKGFTLIEVIVSLVLLSIVAVFAGLGIVRVVESYVFASQNVRLAEQAQLALTRMTLELQYADSVTQAGGNLLTYTTTKDDTGTAHTLQLQGANLSLTSDGSGAHVLLSDLASYEATPLFRYRNFDGDPWTTARPFNELAHVDILLRLQHASAGVLEFQSSTDIRNNGVANAITPEG
ncbi:MAG: type II secretion system protein [Deltaproteobacteria bacterium]|nr:type II secretion system protein [Deltaproteobacteria bacterium]